MPSSPSLDDVVIVSACRTPLCRSRKGGFRNVKAATLLESVLKESLKRTLLPPSAIDDVCVGNVLAPASGAVAWRMACMAAGLSHTTAISTVNRQCSSGLQAVANVAASIASGSVKIGIACGVESMSENPMNKMQPPSVDYDRMPPLAMDCLIPMGVTSENVVREYGLSRTALDKFALQSHVKAAAAQKAGKFRAEIVPTQGIVQDDGIRPTTTLKKLQRLKPVFDPKNGITTAGNSSQTTDGAAAVVMTTRRHALERRLPILGIFTSYACVGVPPAIMGIGPAVAIPAALEKANLSLDQIDVVELNEAFASQAAWCIGKLCIPPSKVNPNGGAIALGHPLGCTGARQVATILYEMHREGHKHGIVSMCIGTGMGAAAVIRVDSTCTSPFQPQPKRQSKL